MQTILPATTLAKWLTGCSGKTRVPPSRQSYELPPRQVLTISLPANAGIRCLRGRLWITSDGSREDVVLTAGKFHEVCGETRVVVEALEQCLLEIGGS